MPASTIQAAARNRRSSGCATWFQSASSGSTATAMRGCFRRSGRSERARCSGISARTCMRDRSAIAYVEGKSGSYIATPAAQLQHLPFYLDARWIMPALAASIVVMSLTLLGWPFAALWRRWRKKRFSEVLVDRRMHRAVRLVLLSTHRRSCRHSAVRIGDRQPDHSERRAGSQTDCALHRSMDRRSRCDRCRVGRRRDSGATASAADGRASITRCWRRAAS